jgi:hypothetical protein
MSLPEVKDVQRLRLEPGDAVVVHVASNITAKEAAGLRAAVTERVRTAMGRDVPVLIVAGGDRLEVQPAGPVSAGAPAPARGGTTAGAPVLSPANPARETTARPPGGAK